MAKNFNNPSIYTPKTLNEVVSILKDNKNIYFFSGGTYILSKKNNYPDFSNKDIIYLGDVAELLKINHSDKFTEFGASISIQKMINSGMQTLGKNTIGALESISTSQIRSLSTIGGALCTPNKRFFLSTILSVLQAQAEIRIFNKKRTIIKFIDIPSLYDENGFFKYTEPTILTKIKIPITHTKNQYFFNLGSPLKELESTVYFGFNFSISQNNIDTCHVCISGPEFFFTNTDFDNVISSITLPLTYNQINNLLHLLKEKISTSSIKISNLQIERAVRLLHFTLKDISERFVSGEYA